VFSASNQKFTYEVRKAYISQQRALCGTCWRESNRIVRQIQACEQPWAEAKHALRTDQVFLQAWLDLLQRQSRFSAFYARNVAHESMLKKRLRILSAREES
jgi:hypothetical protein